MVHLMVPKPTLTVKYICSRQTPLWHLSWNAGSAGSSTMAPLSSSTFSSPPMLFRLLSAERPDWGAAVAQLRNNPEEALHVDESTSQTALHLALAALSSRRRHDGALGQKTNPAEQLRAVVKTLLALNPEATTRRCRDRGYTPLAVACRSASCLETLQEDSKLVKILVMANQRPISIHCDQGMSPLLIHIKSISLLMCQEETARTNLGADATCKDAEAVSSSVSSASSASTAILDVLARCCSQSQLELAIEELYRCNTLATTKLLADEEAIARRDRLVFGLTEPRPSATLAGHRVWEWLLVLLRHVSNRLGNSNGPRATSSHNKDFYPLHVASQIPGCPPPFVLLTIRAFPRDVQTAFDATTGNLPAHQIAMWKTHRGASGMADVPPSSCSVHEHDVTGTATSSTWCRRSMCLTALDSEHPPSMHAKNILGQTPLDLEAESDEHGATIECNA
jgi:hypothetical protein